MSGEHRDDELGEALRSLDVPPHRPTFFDELAERLEREAGPATARPEQTRRPLWQQPAALVAAVAAAAVLVTGVLLPPGDTPGPLRPRVATADEVRSRVAGALAGVRTLRGKVIVTCTIPTGACAPAETGGRARLAWRFVTTAQGDELVRAIGRRDDLLYRPETGVQRSVTDLGGQLSAEVITGLPPGPPDFAARPSVLRRDVAAVLRTFLTTSLAAAVREVDFGGRPSWQLTMDVTPNKLAGPGASADVLEVVVDRRTGFPLQIKESIEGKLLSSVRLSNLVVNEPIPAGTFSLDIPATAETFRQDLGFRRQRFSRAARAVGYVPLVPESVPVGFERAEVAVAQKGLPTGNEAANPPSKNAVSIAFRRGFERIVVTTRDRGKFPRASSDGTGSGPAWSDPLASGEGFFDEPERFRVQEGALAGSTAELVVSARGIPHVWIFGDDLVVTVAGDASAAELRAMAESFR